MKQEAIDAVQDERMSNMQASLDRHEAECVRYRQRIDEHFKRVWAEIDLLRRLIYGVLVGIALVFGAEVGILDLLRSALAG